MRVVLEGYRCLYSPRIQEGFFSETGLPTNTILGNSEDKRAWKAPERFDPGLKLNAQYSYWSSPVIR